MVRVGNGDEGPSPLGQGPPPELCNTVFGHDPVHVVLAGGHHRPWCQGGGDPAHCPALGRGGEGDEALAPLGVGGPPHIVCLPSGPGDVPGPHALGAHLPEEVHLQGSVHRDEAGVLSDDRRVVDLVHWQHQEGRVVVDVVINPLRAKGQRGHALAPVDGLALVGGCPTGEQLHHTVGEELRVDAQLPLLPQGQPHCLRHRPDAQLEGGPVGHLGGDELPNGPAHRVDLHRRGDRQGRLVLTQGGDLTEMDHGGGGNPGQPGVDLQVDMSGLLNERRTHRARQPQTEIAVPVHGGGSSQEGVHLHMVPEELGHIPVVAGHQVPPALVHCLPKAPTGEPGHRGDPRKGLRPERTHRPEVQHGVEGDPRQLPRLSPLSQGLHQGRRDGGRDVRAAAPAGLNPGGDLLRATALFQVFRLVSHDALTPWSDSVR